MGQTATDAAVKKATLRTRAALLRKLVATEKKLEREYGKQLASLQNQLRSTTSAQVQRRIETAMRRISERVVPIVERSIRDGVTAGGDTAAAQFKSVFENETVPKFGSRASAIATASAQIRGTAYVDKIPLSSRIWKNNKAAGKQMAAQIQASIRAGDTMIKTADKVIGYTDQWWVNNPPNISVPKYMRDITDAAKQAAITGDDNLLLEAVKKHRRQIEKLGQTGKGYALSARPVVKQFIKEVKGATVEQIDYHAQRYMIDRARVHARMIARTETTHAYRASYRKSLEGKEWNQGIRWNLASSHPKADICDVLANQDLDGLGPGGYKLENIPDNPHPNCMCYQTAIMDDSHFQRQLAEEKGEKPPPVTWESGKKETGAQWLKKKPASFQKDLLGPTRFDHFKVAPNQVIDPKTGSISLVRDLGSAPPKKAAPKRKPAVLAPAKAPKPSAKVSKEIPTDYDFTLEHPPQGAPKILPSQQMKPGMTLGEVENAIKTSAVEQGAIFDKSGNLLARETSFERGRVYWHDAVVDSPRIKGGIHTHSHPSGQAALSPGDVYMAHANQFSEMRAVVADGRVARLTVTDPVKWANPKAGDAIIRAGDKLKEAAELPFADRMKLIKAKHNRTLTKAAHQKAVARYHERLIAESKKTWSRLGKRYGFKYELLIPK